MERDKQTTLSGLNGIGNGRGAGGKVRRPPSRKAPSTPYDRPRPPALSSAQGEAGGRRWLSKLVDPAYRLISSGATRIFPLLFSKPASTKALPSPSGQPSTENLHADVERDVKFGDGKYTLDLGLSRSPLAAGPSGSVVNSDSVFDGHKHEKSGNLSEDIGLSEIEKILKGRTFSREEVNRLKKVLCSRAVDLGPNMTAGDPVGIVVAHESPRTSLEEKDSKKALQVRDEVGASPVEIARAYMGNRASEIGRGSMHTTSGDMQLPHGDESGAKPFILPPSPKPSACWPGAMAQDEHGYLTPQNHRSRFGLHNFPRTPYSRTIFSKSKTRVTQLRGDSNRGMSIVSTPLEQSQTPLYGQVKRSDTLDNDYGSVVPILRIRHKPLANSSSRASAHFPSLDGSSNVENLNVFEGFLPAVKKNKELGGASGTSMFKSLNSKRYASETDVPMVHPHTNQMARKILEHIDRSVPTPKDKSAELKLAATLKKSESSDVSNVLSKEGNILQNLADKNTDKIDLKNYTQGTEEGWHSRFKVPPKKSPSEATAVNKGGLASPVTKPVLPSISITKPVSRWPLSSDAVSGFTFPFSSSGVEPPTPTIRPLVSAAGLQNPKEGPSVPSYNFGSKGSIPALIFSFPSTSSDNIQEDAQGINYSFGSGDNTRLSFSSFGKDAVCY